MSATGAQLLTPSNRDWAEDPVNETLEPYDDQRPFLSGQERYHSFVSGIGAGKTNAGIQRALLNAQYWNPGETGMIAAPTVPALRNVIIPELRKWNVLNLCEYKSSEKTLVFPNGSRVILESADNDRKIERLRGPSIAWVWMDEAASISERAWDILIGRLRAGEYRNGFITTTPKGFNWVHERFGPDSEANTVLGIPSTANPHIPDDYKADITAQYEGSFYEQEVLGEFTKFEGLVYPWFGEDRIVTHDTLPATYDETIYGVDWGFNSPSALLAIRRGGDEWFVAEEFYERRCTVDDLTGQAAAMEDRHGAGTWYCDAAEPDSIESFRRAGLHAQPAEKAVTEGIRHVTSMQDELHVAETCQNLRNEFGQYQYKDDDQRDDPVKQNDHALDALRYALFTHANAASTDVWSVDLS